MRLLAARSSTLGPLLILILVSAAGCGPPPATLAGSSPSASRSSPGVTPNPLALAPNDCIAPPPSNGTKAHSSVLGASVTLPAGWAEDPTNEGRQGLMAAFDLSNGRPPNNVSISADPWPGAMSPHDVITYMISQPGSGTVVARGDCTIAGGKAAYFEASFPNLFPGISMGGPGYAVILAHGGKSVYLVILPRDGADSGMPEVKSILGSWQWDHG